MNHRNHSTNKWNCLRWLKTVSSTFQDVDFDISMLPHFIRWCFNIASKKYPMVAEHVATIFVTLYVTIATVWPAKHPLFYFQYCYFKDGTMKPLFYHRILISGVRYNFFLVLLTFGILSATSRSYWKFTMVYNVTTTKKKCIINNSFVLKAL